MIRRRKCDLCGERVTEPGRVTLDIVSPGGIKGRLPDVRYKAVVCSVVCLVAIMRSAATDYRRGTKRGGK